MRLTYPTTYEKIFRIPLTMRSLLSYKKCIYMYTTIHHRDERRTMKIAKKRSINQNHRKVKEKKNDRFSASDLGRKWQKRNSMMMMKSYWRNVKTRQKKQQQHTWHAILLSIKRRTKKPTATTRRSAWISNHCALLC